MTWAPLIWGVACGAAASGELDSCKLAVMAVLKKTESGSLVPGRSLFDDLCCEIKNFQSIELAIFLCRELQLGEPGRHCKGWLMHVHVRTLADWIYSGPNPARLLVLQFLSSKFSVSIAKSIRMKQIFASDLWRILLQTINDWYDKEIDAINEPYRPIPSGAISETDVSSLYPEEKFYRD